MADNTKLLEDIATLKLKIDALKAAQTPPAPPPDAQPLIDQADTAVQALIAELP